MAHEFAIVALDGCMASCVTGVLDVLQVANGMLIRGGGFPAFSVRVATPSGVDATGFGGVPIRANASLTDWAAWTWWCCRRCSRDSTTHWPRIPIYSCG